MNVAFGLSRLGVETQFLTRIGQDRDGDQIRKHLDRSGVRLAPSSVTSNATSSATATIQSDGSANYRFDVEWAANRYIDDISIT